jgi:predicted component of type VI protein secretion system
MPAQLVALTDGPSILVDKPILLVGRHPECDIQIESRKVSRRHCCLAQVGDYLMVRDLGSTNGIRINGARVAEGRLNPGDELTIGNSRFQVRWDDLAAAPRPAGGRPPAAPLPDDLLEGCDDPVALDEPEGGPRVPAKPAAPAKPPADPSPPLLPDHLDLAPASDVLSGSSPSHPGAP